MSDLEQFIQKIQDEKTSVEKFAEAVEEADHKAYIEEHNLQWVIDAIAQFSDPEPDVRLDHEFVYEYHKQGFEFPKNPKLITILFQTWLEIMSGVFH